MEPELQKTLAVYVQQMRGIGSGVTGKTDEKNLKKNGKIARKKKAFAPVNILG